MTYEETSKLSEKTLNLRRAIDSLREELEAVDYYQQRADATNDPELKKILEHNRDEEKEHAAMLIEWLRRNDSRFEKELKDYLFTDKEIGSHE
jgi:ferritin-like protein